ncbi:MAG: HesA/MoeB/ThiF family protein [Armatimonadetes bacterium]|nr:HesA/MoeB/ThiF family protein [Armatimonadota bacterium]
MAAVQDERYARQTQLEGFGKAGQERLAQALVLVVGVGGLGCASSPWLVRAGVGRLVVVDPGVVDRPDLGRQLLYTDADIGRPKVTAAVAALRKMNPLVEVDGLQLAVSAENIAVIAQRADVLLDGTDAVAPRLAMNAYGVQSGKPVVFGGAVGWAGSVLTVAPGLPCRECVFADTPPSALCSEAGVAGPVVGWVGAVQAVEVLRLLLGLPLPEGGSLQTVDFWHQTTRRLLVRRRVDCPVCGLGAV